MTGIKNWLTQLGLHEHDELFRENGVDLDLLPELTNDDLKDMGIVRLRDRKILIKAIDELKSTPVDTSARQDDLERQPVQRRQLTVMFCDLVGSTALSTRFDPEDLRELLRAFQATCRGDILEYKGFIARYMGCLLYTSPSPRDQRGSRMPSSA